MATRIRLLTNGLRTPILCSSSSLLTWAVFHMSHSWHGCQEQGSCAMPLRPLHLVDKHVSAIPLPPGRSVWQTLPQCSTLYRRFCLCERKADSWTRDTLTQLTTRDLLCQPGALTAPPVLLLFRWEVGDSDSQHNSLTPSKLGAWISPVPPFRSETWRSLWCGF